MLLIVAAVGAVLGAAQAVMVRPVTPAAFTRVVITLAPLLAHFGVSVFHELVVAINGAIVALMTWGRMSPKEEAVAGWLGVPIQEVHQICRGAPSGLE
ncbi:hypothetical protein [Nocardiopsis synnemataformans]|uniref:hypothetical protein n=1 Tax=Nocardiopsis synnemataformans TaxID=61305 RepID=UPI003EBBD9DD